MLGCGDQQEASATPRTQHHLIIVLRVNQEVFADAVLCDTSRGERRKPAVARSTIGGISESS